MICTKILCRWLQIKLEVFSKDTPDNILWYNCGTKWLWGVYVLHCLENLLRILRILRLLSNLEIVHYTCVTSGLRKYSAHAHCSWYKRWLANCSTKGWRWQDNGTGDGLHVRTWVIYFAHWPMNRIGGGHGVISTALHHFCPIELFMCSA